MQSDSVASGQERYSDSLAASRASLGSRYVRTRIALPSSRSLDDSDGRLSRGSARLATDTDATDCNYPVAKVADLRVLDVDPIEHFVGLSEQFANALVPPIDGRRPSEQYRQRRGPLDIG